MNSEISAISSDEQQFRELCEDTIPPFFRAAMVQQWDETRLAERTKTLTDMLAKATFRPAPVEEARAFLAEHKPAMDAFLGGQEKESKIK